MEVARQVFQVFDSDGDGVLSATEIQQVLHRLGVCVSDQDISLLMNELSGQHGDGNGGSRDTVVTLSSFVELMQTPIPMLQQRYCTCQRHSREQQHQLSMRRKSYPDERYHTSSGTRKPRVDMRRNSVFASRNVRPHHHHHHQHNQLTMDDDDDLYNYLNDHYNHNFNNYHYDSGKQDKKSEKFSLLRTLKKLLPKLTCMHSDDAVAEPCCTMFHDYPLIVADTAQLFPHINPRQMERIQELFTVFKVFDCNGDGQISIHEVQNIVEKLGLQQILSYHELDELFKSVDSNSDGCITFCEFRKLSDF